jgi:hypothetical protein
MKSPLVPVVPGFLFAVVHARLETHDNQPTPDFSALKGESFADDKSGRGDGGGKQDKGEKCHGVE